MVNGLGKLILHKLKNFTFIGTFGVKIKETNSDNILEIFVSSPKIIKKIVLETNVDANEIFKQK